MNASELYKAGNLQEAIDAQIKEVKAQPADQAKRVFLFELLAFAGELERARRQIDAVHYDEEDRAMAVAYYKQLLDAEHKRRQLFAAGLAPQFLTETPPEHLRLRLNAVNRLREQRPAEAAEQLDKAAAATPALKGVLNNKPFQSLRDCDDLLAGVLEVMSSKGDYYWVGLEQVDSLTMNAPRYPRDLLWVPAHLEVRDGPSGDVFLPALYPGSHEHADNQVRLGRLTDWKGAEGGPVLGAGLRTYLVDDDAMSLLEWRELQFS